MEQLRRILLRRWLTLVAIPSVCIVCAEVALKYDLLSHVYDSDVGWINTAVLILAAGTGLGLPVLYRVMFAHAHRSRTSVPIDALYRYENNAMFIALVTPWWTLIAELLNAPRPFILGTFLLAMYAAYTHFPGTVRLETDARIFRVRS